VPPALDLPLDRDGLPAVRVLPAAEYDGFTPASRAAFWSEPWAITPQSDRYGFRLSGPTLEPIAPMELRSHGIVPGVIQVPPGGQPIVQMCDAQPSGGYPKIGTVIEADLWRLGQAPIGASVRFVETTWDDALAARDEIGGWLAEVRRLLDLYRAWSGSR
jgi:allophanate hydrolase subunit 2